MVYRLSPDQNCRSVEKMRAQAGFESTTPDAESRDSTRFSTEPSYFAVILFCSFLLGMEISIPQNVNSY
ncbi:hypothetical protein WN55_04280 [Dufourea novaeangliae]|uniref:Uncharacterized protein n=1 Tax=Dufourea novaeangliae TaxID=178035 RepID=A0A154PLL4_DUFNO|nr:hypothetical protein WN55_04280 [Dufourea novaeangliae]